MASYTDLWKAVSNAASKTQSTPKTTVPTYAYKDPYNPGGSSSSSSYTPASSSSNSSSGSSSLFPFASAIGTVLNPIVGNMANSVANKAANEDPNKNYEGYAQDILNGKITSGTTYDQWANKKESYPGGGLSYGGANGSLVPTYDLYKNNNQNMGSSNTFDVAAALKAAQAQTDANYKQQTDLANQQAEATRTSQLARLRAAYDTQRSDINNQIPELQQTAQQALTQNETDYYNKYKPQMLAAMEQSGGYKGGQMVDGMQGLITALQNNQSNVNTTRLQQEAKLRQALSNLNTQQASDETQVNSNIDASTYDKLMSALQNGQQQKMSLDQMYNDQAYRNATLGLQQQQMANEKSNQDNAVALQRAQVTGYLDPHPGLQINQSIYDQYGNNLQDAINKVNSGELSKDLLPQLEEARYQKVMSNPTTQQQYGGQYQTMQGAAQAAQNQMSQLEAQWKTQLLPLEYQQKIAQIKQEMQNDPLKAQYELQTLAANLDKVRAEVGLTNAQTNNVGSSNALGWANLAWNQNPNNPDNQYKTAQTNALNQKGSGDLASEYTWISSNPLNAPSKIQSQAQSLIGAYGVDTYNKLLDYAKEAAAVASNNADVSKLLGTQLNGPMK